MKERSMKARGMDLVYVIAVRLQGGEALLVGQGDRILVHGIVHLGLVGEHYRRLRYPAKVNFTVTVVPAILIAIIIGIAIHPTTAPPSYYPPGHHTVAYFLNVLLK
jgi:hypothetical protein